MALLIPSPRGARMESNLSGRPSATWGTTLTAAGVHGLGTKATVIASTAFEANRIRVTFAESFVTATITNMLSNVYVGAASSEQVIIPNLYAGHASTIAQGSPPISYEFPLRIAAGSRISADLQSLISGDVVQIRVEVFNDRTLEWVGSKVETLGALTATSRGTQVTAGGASEGTLTSIGTTGRSWSYVVPFCGGTPDTGMNARSFALDIGISSAVIPGLENFIFVTSTSEFNTMVPDGRFCNIPSGTALYARTQAGVTDDADTKSVLLHGVY